MKNFKKFAGEGRKREKRYFYVLWKPENTVRVICEQSYELMTLGLFIKLGLFVMFSFHDFCHSIEFSVGDFFSFPLTELLTRENVVKHLHVHSYELIKFSSEKQKAERVQFPDFVRELSPSWK